MKTLLVFLLGSVSAVAQVFTFGVKAGVPLSDFLTAAQSSQVDYFTHTNRYIVGGAVELHLPLNLGIEADVLYRHLNYQNTSMGVDAYSVSSTTANDFEFPLLAKYRFPMKIVRPYVDAGVAFDTLQGVKQAILSTVLPSGPAPSNTSNPSELHNSTTTGFVMGAGVDIHLLVVHILPEIRYTRWGAQHFFDVNGLLHTNVNQGEFLVGITF
jgi:opacity protein-like surface antigen